MKKNFFKASFKDNSTHFNEDNLNSSFKLEGNWKEINYNNNSYFTFYKLDNTIIGFYFYKKASKKQHYNNEYLKHKPYPSDYESILNTLKHQIKLLELSKTDYKLHLTDQETFVTYSNINKRNKNIEYNLIGIKKGIINWIILTDKNKTEDETLNKLMNLFNTL